MNTPSQQDSDLGQAAGRPDASCSAFSDSDRLTWLIRENADSLIDPSWARFGEDPQKAVRERIDKHMISRPNGQSAADLNRKPQV